jgi:hypothetical protein
MPGHIEHLDRLGNRRRDQPVGCAKSGSCGEAVFVDESAEPVSTLDDGRRWMQDRELPGRRIGRLEVE